MHCEEKHRIIILRHCIDNSNYKTYRVEIEDYQGYTFINANLITTRVKQRTKMYISGAIIGFILGFIIFIIQGIKRKQKSNESLLYVFLGALFGAIMAAVLSWLSVILFILFILGGKVWGISDKNL